LEIDGEFFSKIFILLWKLKKSGTNFEDSEPCPNESKSKSFFGFVEK